MHVPVVTSSTSCSADSASAMAHARMAGPAMRADSVSPVAITILRRALNAPSMPNASTSMRWAASYRGWA